MKREQKKFLSCLKKSLFKKDGKKKMSYEELSKKVKIPRSTLYGIFEEGRRSEYPHILKLLKYSDCYIVCNETEDCGEFFRKDEKKAA